MYYSFVGSIRGGRDGVWADPRVAVRPPWSFQFPAYVLCGRESSIATSCVRVVMGARDVFSEFCLFSVCGEVFGCLVVSGGA